MRHSDSHVFRLRVLGAPDLRAPDGRRITSVLSQPKRLGLLTYLALAPGPVSRASLVALFWPESDEARARNALSQAVFHLRRSLDERVVQSVEGDRLWAPAEHLWCDARERLGENESALRPADADADADGDASAGVDHADGTARVDATSGASGELLDGWNAEDSLELQEWLDAQRRRLRERAAAAVSPMAPPDPLARPAQPAGHPPASPLPSPRSRPSTFASPRPGWRTYARLAGAAALAVLAVVLIIFVASASDRGPAAVGAASPQSLAVLMPQISATPDAPDLDPGAVHAEILANLPHVADLRIVSATYARSLQDFRRQLEALGVEAPELPRWILEVSIRVTRNEARAIGLLHRSPTFDLPGRVSFGVTYAGVEAAMLEAPQQVASEVSIMVARVLREEGAGP